MDVVRAVRARGHFSDRRSLIAFGASPAQLAAAVHSGELGRPRRGWYSDLPVDDPRFRAVAIGGRLTGLSAVEALGGWVWNRPERIQVAVARDASRIADRRARFEADLRWEPPDHHVDPSVVGVRRALLRCVLDADHESAVAAIDWAWHVGLVDRIDVESLAPQVPEDLRWLIGAADRASESVLESVARLRLHRLGWRVRSQVPLRGVRRLDLVVEDQIAVELDGRGHADTFERDRRRDLDVTADGRHSIRISASMLRDDWPAVVLAISSALHARGVAPAAPRVPSRNSGVRPAVASHHRGRTR